MRSSQMILGTWLHDRLLVLGARTAEAESLLAALWGERPPSRSATPA